MADLFDRHEGSGPPAPEAQAPASRRPTPRPAFPGGHACYQCGAHAYFGLGNTWFCREHMPPDFLPHFWVPRAGTLSICVHCGVERTEEALLTRCSQRGNRP